ncbi:MAG: family 43 glycosylhydrolase [Chitinispirillaceae bacterium]|nr:family 43 glycosylhydrolase [Chitinispirillaceae bacterium]
MKSANCFLAVLVVLLPLYAAWDTPDNGNPLLPGYTADPSIIYDSISATFYIYSTSDGVWISYSADPQVAWSKDFINWTFRPLQLPSFWPKTQLWAPSAMRHPINGKFYLMYCTGSAVHIAWADSAYGPWNNAVANNGTLYNSGDLTGGSDWIDPQFFIDTTTVYFTFGQSSNMGIAKLKFDPNTFMVTFDGSDSRMTDGVKFKCRKLTGLSNNLEGSCMFRNADRYFITYSNSACQNYNVRYAVASSPVGPFTYINRIVVQRDNENNILGPGHNSILHYGIDWYICYHRQHYQYIDVKRQTCIDRITINGDNISTASQTQGGVWAGSGSLESLVAQSRSARKKDLAFGKTVLASSESDFKGGRSGN